MASWFTAQGSGLMVPRALSIVAATVFHAIVALGIQPAGATTSVVIGSMEGGSTLGAFVPPQNFDLKETVIDVVGSGVLTGQKSALRFDSPRNVSRTPDQMPERATKLAGPMLHSPDKVAPIESSPDKTQAEVQSEQHTSEQVARRESPFRKWVKPSTNAVAKAVGAAEKATEPLNRVDEEPLTPTPEEADAEADAELEADLQQPRKLERVAPHTSPSPPLAPAIDTPQQPTPVKRLPPLTAAQQQLRQKVRTVLTHYYNRPLNTRDRSPWELMHAMLAFEAESKVLQGGPDGKPITAVGWLCFNQACKRRTLMYVDDDGRLQVRVGPALQGHHGQLLAMLAQSRINPNYPLLVDRQEMKIADLIDMEKRTCYPRTELTFKLIALMHYLDSDATWMNDQGMTWSIPKLIAEELQQPVRGAACGGTHRLSGLTLAYKTRQARGEPITGEYLQAQRFVARYQQYAYRLQNRDGSFSTEWFRGPGNEQSIDRKFKTTGHILEWLLYAADEQQLHHWRTTKAVNYLSSIMLNNRYKDWESGPMGHAIHALLVYDRLAFSAYDEEGESPLATKPMRSRR